MSTAAKQTRENRTIPVDFRDAATYGQLLGDGKAFVECVCACLLSLGFQLAQTATCQGGGGPDPICIKVSYLPYNHDFRLRERSPYSTHSP